MAGAAAGLVLGELAFVRGEVMELFNNLFSKYDQFALAVAAVLLVIRILRDRSRGSR